MIAKKRISITLLSNVSAELVGKAAPVAMLFLAQKRLGVASFGFSQVGITLIEMSVPFIVFGYSQYGAIELGKRAEGREQGELISTLVSLRLLHATIALLILFGCCYGLPKYRPHLGLIFAVSGVLFLAAIDLLWMLIAKQRMAIFSVFSIIAKTSCITCAYFWVQGPQDAIWYAICTLWIGNGIIYLGAFAYYAPQIQWTRPRHLWKIFTQVKGFACVAIWLIWMDRIDLLIVKDQLGLIPAGLYATASRMNQALLQLIWTLSWVFFSEMVGLQAKQDLSKHLHAATFVISACLAPILVGIFFFSSDLLRLIGGPFDEQVASTLSILVIGSTGTAGILLFGQQVLQLRDSVGKMLIALGVGLTCTLLYLWVFLPHGGGLQTVAQAQAVGKWVAMGMMIYWARPFVDRLPWLECVRCIIPALIMGGGLLLCPTKTLGLRASLAVLLYSIPFVLFHWSQIKEWLHLIPRQ